MCFALFPNLGAFSKKKVVTVLLVKIKSSTIQKRIVKLSRLKLHFANILDFESLMDYYLILVLVSVKTVCILQFHIRLLQNCFFA